ncbi:hypothetical protein PABG_12378 [Paracoccidioides brasiliensis Pb03]|nr:hypothetical protein PABG_12378 [Paracoccidioides brasiliensis Pb03]
MVCRTPHCGWLRIDPNEHNHPFSTASPTNSGSKPTPTTVSDIGGDGTFPRVTYEAPSRLYANQVTLAQNVGTVVSRQINIISLWAKPTVTLGSSGLSDCEPTSRSLVAAALRDSKWGPQQHLADGVLI